MEEDHAKTPELSKSHFDSMEPSIKRLVQRASSLTFGIFATIGEEEYETRGGGSGILVAPFLAITARHITNDLYRLEGKEKPNRPALSVHAPHLFQIHDPFNPSASLRSLWHADRSWDSPHTDITLLQVSAESEGATRLQFERTPLYFHWRLLPPPIGSMVSAIGFPQLGIKPTSKNVVVDVPFTVQRFHVTKIHPLRRDRGMMNFPCFEVDDTVEHGFSGGPVFFEDKLCGIVSSGSGFDKRSYIATLWPLTLMDFTNEFGLSTRFGDLLNRGVIIAEDWLAIRDRISKGERELEGPFAFIDPPDGS